MSTATDLAAAVTSLPHTYRDGSVTATLHGVRADEKMLTVVSLDAEFEGQPVQLNTPLHYVNPPSRVSADDESGNLLSVVERLVADTIRETAAKNAGQG